MRRNLISSILSISLLSTLGCSSSEDALGSGGAGAGAGAAGANGAGDAGAGDAGAGDKDRGDKEGPQDDDASFPSESRVGMQLEGGGTASGYHVFDLSIGGDEYFVQTNPWGGAEQVIEAGKGKVFEVVSIVGPGDTAPWQVVSFPSVYKGGGQSGDITSGSGMPRQVSEITSVRTGMKTNASAIDYRGNATYDVYFTDSPEYIKGAPDDFLMVWFESTGINPINSPGEGWSCAGDAPTQIEACTGAGQVEIQGKVFHRFVGPNNDHTVISYVPEVSFDEWEFELKDFIDDAVDEGVLSESQYLQAVQGGFELIDGGDGLTVFDFYAEIQ